MPSLKEKIYQINIVKKVINLAKKITLPGLDRIPIYDVIRFFFKAINEGVIAQRAAAISFNFFVAIFPGILFVFTLIPYIPIENFQNELLRMVYKSLPSTTSGSVIAVIEDIITRPRDGVLSVGFFLALLFFTNGFKSVISAFNSSVYIKEDRSFISLQIVSLVLVFVFLITATITIAAIALNEYFLQYLVNEGFIKQGVTYYLILIGNWILLIGMVFFMVSFLYYFAPKSKDRFRLISAGSTISTAIIILVIFGFNMYINNFGKYNVLYGSIGTLLVVLMWIYINAFILLLGFEINTSIKAAKHDNRIKNKNILT